MLIIFTVENLLDRNTRPQMASIPFKTHYPTDIKLQTGPLVEAWLTIHWQIDEIQKQPPVGRDPGFDFAFINRFYEVVKSKYEQIHELNAVKVAPLELTPHQPRYQFRTSDEVMWPLLQLGPGMASLNFTEPYTWPLFETEALFLRDALLTARETESLETQQISLRYRNAFPCKYSSVNLLRFLGDYLNVLRLKNWTLFGQVIREGSAGPGPLPQTLPV